MADETNSEGKVVTFYSFKGGTGRTMALANVAWILASNGLKVLVVDWDLDSPGLHRYFHPFLDPAKVAAEENLDAETLMRWGKYLSQPRKIEHPFLKPWVAMMANGGGSGDEAARLAGIAALCR